MQQQFDEMQQMIATRDEESAEHKKQLEAVKEEMEMEKLRLQEVCKLHVDFLSCKRKNCIILLDSMSRN